MSTRPRLAAVVAAIAWLTLTSSTPTSAHRGSSKLLTVERTEAGARLEIELDPVDCAVELGLREDAPLMAIRARQAELRRWLVDGITLHVGDSACPATITGPTSRQRVDGARLVFVLDAVCPEDATGRARLRDETVFEDDAQHEAFVHSRWSGGNAGPAVLRRGRQEATLGEPASVPALLGRFVLEGARHLVTGYDHLLFLLSLVLTAGGLARREGTRAALKDVAALVTAFTVGHSVTLIAAALGWVVLPSRLVESVIALSIAIVAGINIARPRARRAMPWLALGFGLIHGFGFSGVLSELGLPARARVLSLVAFNVGIELAQLAFVALALLPLARAAEWGVYERWVVRGGSMVIGVVALGWFVERLV